MEALNWVDARLVVAVALTVTCLGEARGQEIGRPREADIHTIGRYVFAGVAIDHYEATDLWKTLEAAVTDVEGVRDALRDVYDFASPDEWLLFDEGATRFAIASLVDRLAEELQPDDALVFMFSGHVANRSVDFDGEIVSWSSYLVPWDAADGVDEHPAQYLDVDRLLDGLAELPARHVLVILDGLYSGFAPLELKSTARGDGTGSATDLIARRSRQVMTSAGPDQLAEYGGPNLFENSLFGGWLIEGLRRGADPEVGEVQPDSDEDGLITSVELFAFVSGQVAGATQSRQYPDFGAFKFDNQGSLVLFTPTAR